MADDNASARVPNEARGLQSARSKRNGASIGGEHPGEELLGERQCFAVDPIANHQKPSGKARFDVVQSVAEHSLLRLCQNGLHIGRDDMT